MQLFIAISLFLVFTLLIGGAILFLLAIADMLGRKDRRRKSVLERYARNPVISPKPEHGWEAGGTFNPGAITDKNGRVHILYRATGEDGVSRVGYASSADGIHFEDRLPYPVFAMQSPRRNIPAELSRLDFVLYPSGGSWGGVEDPRLVKIDGWIYVTFNAFDGWDSIRMGVISIDERNFFEKKWKWSKPFFISPPKEINKNWVLFPEKINGQFAVLHSISPTVQIDYFDRLEDLADGKRQIKSRFGQKGERRGWDSWRRGVGPPPIKTKKGWLVLYHAIEERDPSRYKLGAMLLDLKNPMKVLGNAPLPLLAPEFWYENDWKPGVVYACGAVVKGETLFVYYGGGDKYVCVASAPLKKILSLLRPV